MRNLSALFLTLTLLFPAAAQSGSAMPRIEGQSLAGSKVVLPEATGGRVALLIFGFTHASKTSTSEWARKIPADFGSQPGFVLYQLPVLEDVPRLIRGMVISGIKKSVPENQRDHFVILVQSEAELKKFVGYKEPDEAYLVLLDQNGKVVQQRHGKPEGEIYAAVKDELALLLSPHP